VIKGVPTAISKAESECLGRIVEALGLRGMRELERYLDSLPPDERPVRHPCVFSINDGE